MWSWRSPDWPDILWRERSLPLEISVIFRAVRNVRRMEPVRRSARRITVLPFIGSEALAAGVVNRYQLATRYRAVYRNVYVPRGQVLTAADKAVAAWLWSER